MTDHRAEAATQAGPGGTLSFGWCSCGWRGPTRPDRKAAEQDANDHAVDMLAPRRGETVGEWKERTGA
jgi:hypothetical protein